MPYRGLTPFCFTRRRLLVGPDKKKGFYGFFLQKGWIWSKGRRRRAASGNTHSQSGSTEGSHRIPPHPWFPNPAEVEAQAFAAGERVFIDTIQQLTK
jgi:hypothetical protein